jgi:CheY-like chemotaxis protein
MPVKPWEFTYLLMTLSFPAIQCFLYLRQVLCSGTLKRFNRFALKMAAPSPTIARKPVILCVEDNEIYLRLRKAVLEQAGYAVLSATTGTEAMEILRDAPVCLVLSDHMLRGTTGTFLAKQMKKMKRDVPIILYSGKPPKSIRNLDGFINKDESVPRFLSLIGDFVKRYRE